MQPSAGIAAFFTVLLLTCSFAAGNDLRSSQDTSQNKRSESDSSEEDNGAYSLSGFLLMEDAKTAQSTLPSSTVVEHKDVGSTPAIVNASIKRLPGKVGHIDVTNNVNKTHIKQIKKEKIEAASVAMPMASFALEGPKEVEKKVEKPFPGNATQKAAFEKREKAVENQLAALKGRFKVVARVVNNTSHLGKVGHINVAMPVPAPVKQVLKNSPVAEKVEHIKGSVPAPVVGKVGHIKVKHLAPMEGKVGHIKVVSVPAPVKHVAPKSLPVAEKVGHFNVPVVDPSGNNKQVAQSSTKAKVKAKAIDDLPMAGLAFDEPEPAPAKPKFPGNSTQQAAFENKAESLEDQVASLNARLSTVSESLIPVNPKSAALATGTFHAHIHHKDGDVSKTFMAPTGPEPMQPIIDYKDKKPKADWPTMASVAAPVAKRVKNVVALTRSGSREDKKIYMGTAFTGTPAKKVQSILALESAVQRGAVIIEGDDAEQAAPVSHVPGWLSSLSSWFQGAETPPPAPVSPKTQAVSLLATPHAGKPFAWTKQDRERTEQATLEDSQHIFDVTSSWSQLEKQDNVEERDVRSQDMAERQLAATVELPHKPSKTELDAKRSVPMSGFWRGLEKEDNSIQDTVGSDDLVKYAELTHAQDVRVAQANDMLSDAKLSTNQKIQTNRDARIAIHEPWLVRETQDTSIDRSIHDDPYLQMLQVGHRHRHLHH